MAEVTPTIIDASFFPVPGAKAFEVTADDGDYFIARNMSNVKVAIAAWAEDPSTGNPVAAVISDGNKITIECTSASGKKFQVICIGR
jgi:hypothetical protein